MLGCGRWRERQERQEVPIRSSVIKSAPSSTAPNGSINDDHEKLIPSQGLSFRQRSIRHPRSEELIRREGVEEQVDHCPRPPGGDSGPSGWPPSRLFACVVATSPCRAVKTLVFRFFLLRSRAIVTRDTKLTSFLHEQEASVGHVIICTTHISYSPATMRSCADIYPTISLLQI
jgi:hypothetical protein